MKLNWAVAKIEEIADVNPRLGKADIPDDLLVSFVPMPAVGAGDGSIDVSTVRPFGEVKKGFTSFQQGDVLFAKITPCMENGKMAVVPEVKNGYGFGSTEFHILRPKPGINPRYLYFYVSSSRFRSEAEHEMTGAVGQKRVPTQYLRECAIPLAPTNEQTRIVAEIEKQFSRLDEAVANLKRVKANLKRYKAAVLKAAVEGKLTEEWRRRGGLRPPDSEGGHTQCAPTETGAELLERILAERRKATGKGKYKEPVGPDTSGLPELPEGWVWASVDQLVANITDGDHQAPPQTDRGIPFLVIGNVRSGQIDFSDTRFVGEAYYRSLDTKRQPKQGDLLYTLVGSYGIPVAVRTDKPFCIQRHMAILRPHKKSPMDFLALAMKSDNIFKQATTVATGTAQMTVPLAGLRKISIPLPALAEQHQIVTEIEHRLSIIAEAEAQVDANLRRADRLRQSILEQAFSGQLVPQDPNDEPASVLLAKIPANTNVGATHASPKSKPRATRARHASPLQETKPTHAAPDEFTSLDSVLASILNRMQPGREYSRAEIVDTLGLSTGRWNAAIQELKRRGNVWQVGEKRGARYLLKVNF